MTMETDETRPRDVGRRHQGSVEHDNYKLSTIWRPKNQSIVQLMKLHMSV